MEVSTWVWIVTILGIVGLFVFDFYSHIRVPHAPGFKESAKWTGFYVSLACLFGVGVFIFAGPTSGGEYFAGYITEWALSVDNLFVFALIMGSFAVPRELQQRVLMVGIVIALILRGIFIAVGAAAINNFSWVFYIFGAVLLWTAVKMLIDHQKEVAADKRGEEEEFQENGLVRWLEKILPVSKEYDGSKLITRIDAKKFVTPLLIVMIAIGSTDVLFALDSIPAIFGLTQEPYIVFTANAFALMGLRQLYFLLDGLLDRLIYLSYGLSIILAFIGVKLVLHAMHENELSFINGGEHFNVPEVGIGLSLSVIIGVLVVTTGASLFADGRRRAKSERKAKINS